MFILLLYVLPLLLNFLILCGVIKFIENIDSSDVRYIVVFVVCACIPFINLIALAFMTYVFITAFMEEDILEDWCDSVAKWLNKSKHKEDDK